MSPLRFVRGVAPGALVALVAVLAVAGARAEGAPGRDISTSGTLSDSGTYTGQPNDIGGPGLQVDSGAAVTVTAGNYIGGNGSDAGGAGAYVTGDGTVLTIDGGSFSGGQGTPANTFDGDALDADAGTTANVYGGDFAPGGSDSYDFDAAGTIDLYGNFVGGAQTITSGSGTITGYLANDSATDVTYSYFANGDGGGVINLIESAPLATPEPSSLTACVLFAALAAALALRRRRQRTAA